MQARVCDTCACACVVCCALCALSLGSCCVLCVCVFFVRCVLCVVCFVLCVVCCVYFVRCSLCVVCFGFGCVLCVVCFFRALCFWVRVCVVCCVFFVFVLPLPSILDAGLRVPFGISYAGASAGATQTGVTECFIFYFLFFIFILCQSLCFHFCCLSQPAIQQLLRNIYSFHCMFRYFLDLWARSIILFQSNPRNVVGVDRPKLFFGFAGMRHRIRLIDMFSYPLHDMFLLRWMHAAHTSLGQRCQRPALQTFPSTAALMHLKRNAVFLTNKYKCEIFASCCPPSGVRRRRHGHRRR